MIEINNRTRTLVNEPLLKKVAERVLRGEGKEGMGISIALVGPKRMRELNKKYRKRDKAANVLSFSAENERIPSEVEGLGLGEVVICPQEVKKDAKKYGMIFEKALAWMLIHGILHLLGYDHEKSEKAARKMEQKEASYLEMASRVM